MTQCLVIADDLTGANATGVLLKKMKYKAMTVLNDNMCTSCGCEENDCLLFPTDSRAIDKKLAYERVYRACSTFAEEGIKLYAKRIDSTLRGNLGAETDGMLDALGDDYIAVVAPCFPSANRIIAGGYLLVKGLPVHKTDIAIDPKTPVKESKVASIFSEQSKYKVDEIKIGEMMSGKHKLADLIRKKVDEGNRIICFDCITQEDLELIADACITSKLKIVAVDPGAFTATLARKIIVPVKTREKSRILAVVGSVNPATKLQVDKLILSQRVNKVEVNTEILLEGEEEREEEVRRVIEAILENADKNVVNLVVTNGLEPGQRIDFQKYIDRYNMDVDSLTEIINNSFATITHEIFKRNSSFKALYTSGGDITVSLCRKFNIAGLDLRDEVLPLAAYGKLIDGDFPDVHIVTKGGSQGGSDAINQCITYLREKIYV